MTWPVCFTFYVLLLLEIVNKNFLKLLISHMPTNVISDQVTALNYITRSFQISIHHWPPLVRQTPFVKLPCETWDLVIHCCFRKMNLAAVGSLHVADQKSFAGFPLFIYNRIKSQHLCLTLSSSQWKDYFIPPFTLLSIPSHQILLCMWLYSLPMAPFCCT